MKKEQQELSYYGLYLLRYLMEQHSKKTKDLNFIYQRELQAAETFEQARREGHSVEGAQELAMDALMKGLSMTPWSILMEVLTDYVQLSTDYVQLYTELTGAVVLYIEQYGVQ